MGWVNTSGAPTINKYDTSHLASLLISQFTLLTIKAQTPLSRSAVSWRLVKFESKLTAPASNMGYKRKQQMHVIVFSEG